jgi:hypothetical protein
MGQIPCRRGSRAGRVPLAMAWRRLFGTISMRLSSPHARFRMCCDMGVDRSIAPTPRIPRAELFLHRQGGCHHPGRRAHNLGWRHSQAARSKVWNRGFCDWMEVGLCMRLEVHLTHKLVGLGTSIIQIRPFCTSLATFKYIVPCVVLNVSSIFFAS